MTKITNYYLLITYSEMLKRKNKQMGYIIEDKLVGIVL